MGPGLQLRAHLPTPLLTRSLERVEAALAAARGRVLLAIVLASVVIRVVYLAQAWDGPILSLHRSPMSDMHANDLVARQVAAGDLLLDRTLHPFHEWHEALAERHFARHPGAREELARASDAEPGRSPAHQLWDAWYGGRTFHQEPFYPYLLGASRALFGESVLPVLLLQLAVGVGGNVLAFLVARRAFGEMAGLAAAGLATLCGPLVHYELVLLRDSMLASGGLVLVLLAQRASDRPIPLRFATFGAAGGLALLLKSSLVLFLVGAMAGLLVPLRHPLRRLVAASLAFFAAIAIVLAPAIARNVAVGVPPLALSSTGAITFVAANTEDYGRSGGVAGEFFVSERHAAAIMSGSNGRFWPAVRAALSTHESVESYLGQLAIKLGAIFWGYEIPNNTSFEYFGLHAPVLRWLPVGFSVIGPLGLLGLAFAVRAWRRIWPVAWLVATTLAVLLGFGVFSRLRLPLVSALLPFAGFALVRFADLALSRRFAPLAAAGAALAVLVAWTLRPLPPGHPRIRPSDYSAAYIAHYGPEVDAAYASHDPCSAASIYERSLGFEPAELRGFAGRTPPELPYQVQLAAIYRKVHARHAAALDACLAATADPAERGRIVASRDLAKRRMTALDEALAAVAQRP